MTPIISALRKLPTVGSEAFIAPPQAPLSHTLIHKLSQENEALKTSLKELEEKNLEMLKAIQALQDYVEEFSKDHPPTEHPPSALTNIEEKV